MNSAVSQAMVAHIWVDSDVLYVAPHWNLALKEENMLI